MTRVPDLPRVGAWYVPAIAPTFGRRPPRWVLAVKAGRVLYTRGGGRHYECLIATFNRWTRDKFAAPSCNAKGN